MSEDPAAGRRQESLMQQRDLFGDDAGAAAERAPTHFDTTHEPRVQLEEYRRKCGEQQRLVLDWFRRHPDELATPFEIRDRVMPRVPITSVRRAITNLTTIGLLEKTDTQRAGKYGRRNYCWRLAVGVDAV